MCVKKYIKYKTIDAINNIINKDLFSSSRAAFEAIKYCLTIDINTDSLYLIYKIYLKYQLLFKNTNFANKMIKSKEILSHIFMESYLKGNMEKNIILNYIVYVKKFDKIIEGLFSNKLTNSSNTSNVFEIYSNFKSNNDKYISNIISEFYSEKEYDPDIKINGLTINDYILSYIFRNAISSANIKLINYF